MSTSSAAVNALAQDPAIGSYPVEVCYDSLTCKLYFNNTDNSCDGLSLSENRPYVCVASLESNNAALVSKGCDAGNDYKLCCTDQPMCGVPLEKRKCGEVQGSGGLTACDNTTDDWGCPVDATDCIYNTNPYQYDDIFATRDTKVNITYLGESYAIACSWENNWCPEGWVFDTINRSCKPDTAPCYMSYSDPSVPTTCFATEFTDAWLDDQVDFLNTVGPPPAGPNRDCFLNDATPQPDACCSDMTWAPGGIDLYQYQDIIIY